MPASISALTSWVASISEPSGHARPFTHGLRVVVILIFMGPPMQKGPPKQPLEFISAELQRSVDVGDLALGLLAFDFQRPLCRDQLAVGVAGLGQRFLLHIGQEIDG